jgi:hypothetical protein
MKSVVMALSLWLNSLTMFIVLNIFSIFHSKVFLTHRRGGNLLLKDTLRHIRPLAPLFIYGRTSF